jgi:hypothetical protein
MHPLNAAVERATREIVLGSATRFDDALAALVADSTWRALLVVHIGYPTHAGLRSPRRSVDQVAQL